MWCWRSTIRAAGPEADRGRRRGADVDFKDAASGQLLKMRSRSCKHRCKRSPITAQPWFEINCRQPGSRAPTLPRRAPGWWPNSLQLCAVGDLSSTILELARNGILNPNVGLYAQTGANGYIGNYASSSYNALLMSVRKRYSNNLLIDFDYLSRIRSTINRTSRTIRTSLRSAGKD